MNISPEQMMKFEFDFFMKKNKIENFDRAECGFDFEHNPENPKPEEDLEKTSTLMCFEKLSFSQKTFCMIKFHQKHSLNNLEPTKCSKSKVDPICYVSNLVKFL